MSALATTSSKNGASRTVDPAGPTLDWGLWRIRKALKRHDDRCERYAQRHRVWLATREGEQKNLRNQRIRFAYQHTDVLMSYLTTDKPVARIAPLRPAEDCEASAKAAQRALNIWRRVDHRDEKETQLALNACIFGTAPFKSIWDYSDAMVKRREVKKAFLGVGPTKYVVQEQLEILTDQPSLIPWDPFDFAWDPRAAGVDDMRYAIFFSYPSKPELMAMQAKGVYSNIDDLSPANNQQARQFQRVGKDRDLEGCIEVAEIWDKEQNRQVSIANRTTVICDRDNPYWHGQIPGGVCSTQPNLWTLDGTSEVEVIAAIQQEMHSFRENWIFDAKLATKLVAFIDSSIPATEMDKINNSLMVDDGRPVQIIPTDPGSNPPTFWNPGAALVPLGEQIINALKTDMDDMSGVNQYISGQAESDVDPKTATEVTQLATASQRRINAKKNQLGYGFLRATTFDAKNMKQFMSTDKPLMIRMDGYVPDADITGADPSATFPDSDYSWSAIEPQDVIDAEFEVLISDADESLDEQAQRTQWLTLFNTFAMAAPAVFPPGSAAPNWAKMAEKILEVFDVETPSDYITEPPPPMIAPPMPPNGEPPLSGGGGVATPLGPAPPPFGGPGQAAPNPGAAA